MNATVVNRTKLESLLKENGGKFFSVTYKLLSGRVRMLNGRFGVVKYLKGGANNVEKLSNPYLVVFDVQKMGYRTINLATIESVRMLNREFKVS